MAAFEVLALDTATPQIRAPGTGDTYTAPRAFALSPASLTGSAATVSFDIAQTWNTSGTPTAIKLNVTDTASNAASLLMDLQVGGSSRFSVQKDGVTTVGNNIDIVYTGTTRVQVWPTLSRALSMGSDLDIAWSSTTSANGSADLSLFRDAANTLAQRNSTNAQTFRLYNTFTDASNYERGKMEWASNVLRIGTEKAGTGTARALELQTDGTTAITVGIDQAVTFASLVNISGAHGLQILSGIYGPFWAAGTTLASSTNGNLTLFNFALNDWGRLQFGGTTSSFPALKRNSAALQVRLADDTANAALESASIKTDAPAGGTSGTWKLGIAASVSPTSPNRTVEVDIGGTIYYIAAKTTND